jgi:hypothetical protein
MLKSALNKKTGLVYSERIGNRDAGYKHSGPEYKTRGLSLDPVK